MRNKNQSEAAALKYILQILYIEMHAHTECCDYCEDVLFLFRKLQKLIKEHNVVMKEFSDDA